MRAGNFRATITSSLRDLSTHSTLVFDAAPIAKVALSSRFRAGNFRGRLRAHTRKPCIYILPSDRKKRTVSVRGFRVSACLAVTYV
jgi:hypothetical protein